MSGIISETSSVDVTDGSRHSKKSVAKKTSPVRRASLVTSPPPDDETKVGDNLAGTDEVDQGIGISLSHLSVSGSSFWTVASAHRHLCRFLNVVRLLFEWQFFKHQMIVFTTSVTRLLDYLFNIWAFKKLKIAPKHIKFAKLSSKCFQIQNELVQNGQSFLTFCQSGEILPNLVTLYTTLRVTL